MGRRKARINHDEVSKDVSLLDMEVRALQIAVESIFIVLKKYDRNHRVERGDGVEIENLRAKILKSLQRPHQKFLTATERISGTLLALRAALGLKSARTIWAITKMKAPDAKTDITLMPQGVWRHLGDEYMKPAERMRREADAMAETCRVLRQMNLDRDDHVEADDVVPMINWLQTKLARVLNHEDDMMAALGDLTAHPKSLRLDD
jgi:hypothetical protein